MEIASWTDNTSHPSRKPESWHTASIDWQRTPGRCSGIVVPKTRYHSLWDNRTILVARASVLPVCILINSQIICAPPLGPSLSPGWCFMNCDIWCSSDQRDGLDELCWRWLMPSVQQAHASRREQQLDDRAKQKSTRTTAVTHAPYRDNHIFH